tara:strand:- start:1474 stop:2826 length:1353 start_codon:yes stop_codon:yes gene_type:complete
MSERGDKFREKAELADQEEELRERQKTLTAELEADVSKYQWLEEQPLSSHFELEKRFAEHYNVGLSDARKAIRNDLRKYEIEGKDIPMMVKELKMYRRTLKGEPKIAVTKSIENLIDAYSSHLDESINKIYWIKKYKSALKDMTLSEENIIKLSLIHDESTRREIVDTLCKYWESRLDRDGMAYGEEYAKLTKEMTNSKRAVNSRIRKYIVNIGPKELIKRHIVKLVSEEQGISARQVHERLPQNLFKKSSPAMISKMARTANVTVVDGALYKMSDEIKKDIYAYTAAFIDSDGYITMDKNHNPRVGLVATGDRGKAFMLEMHKSLGCGRLHLDQKSPQDTKPINRLNFYSRKDVGEILSKCMPYFKLKKKNAEILVELLRMKKSHKKAGWYNARKVELFKLMKYENHKDDKNYDFAKYEIDIDSVVKYYDNDKMSEMDKLEAIVKNEDE